MAYDKAKAATNYARADKIFNLLSREYGVNIKDRANKWALIHEEYAFNPDALSFVLSKDVIAAISRKLGERILAQKRRNFDQADNISNELRNKFMVEIKDETKEWMAVVPRGGWWSNNNDKGGYEGSIVSREE
jgi:hypothetical protein